MLTVQSLGGDANSYGHKAWGEVSWVLNACHQAVTDSNADTMPHPFAFSMSAPEEGVVLFTNGSTASEPGFTKVAMTMFNRFSSRSIMLVFLGVLPSSSVWIRRCLIFQLIQKGRR